VETTSCSAAARAVTVYLGPGEDWVDLGADSDALFVAVDGKADIVFCGPGKDAVYHGPVIDPADEFHGCETFRPHP